MLKLVEAKKQLNHSFVEYLQGGTQMCLQVGIDFTASNGYPHSRESLHYINPQKPNNYQEAILAVGSILLNYDDDKLVPVYGFGARTRFPKMQGSGVNHCFPCSGDFDKVDGREVRGVFELYTHCLQNVEFSGPTYFAPLLKENIHYTRQALKTEPWHYSILLILTDGAIHDMNETIDLVVEASRLPLSIIIVGIGNADFRLMDALDSDDQVRFL